jgi:molecular chaperone GrpE
MKNEKTKQTEEVKEATPLEEEAHAAETATAESAESAEAGPTAEIPADTTEATEVVEEEQLSELDKAKAEAADMKARYLRSVADMENFRKRMARDKQDIIRNAAAGVIESLLPVLDNMKLGLQAAENHPEAKDVMIGFKMVDDQLKKSLSEQGLEELIPDGEQFDPNLHECISHQPSEDVAEDYVIQTVRAGYRLNDRLIRAANVIVSSGPAKEDT